MRAEQIELARYFIRNLADGGTLLLEGGTGVGKSFAYLAAAIPFALAGPFTTRLHRVCAGDRLCIEHLTAPAGGTGHPYFRPLPVSHCGSRCRNRGETAADLIGAKAAVP